MKAMLCRCGRRLEAANDDGLVREAMAHHHRESTASGTDEDHVRRIVEKNAYDLERAAPYAYGERPDEEFGLEPY